MLRTPTSSWSVVAMTILGVILVLAMTSRHVVRASIADYEEEDEIIILNASNFDKALAEFKYLFVDFCEFRPIRESFINTLSSGDPSVQPHSPVPRPL